MTDILFDRDITGNPTEARPDADRQRKFEPRKTPFLGLNFHNLSLQESLDKIDDFIETGIPRKICTVNVTLLMWARKNAYLRRVYATSDILGVDGMAIYYASKLFGTPFKESISASLMFYPLLAYAEKNQRSIYLVGAEQDVILDVVENLRRLHPGLDIRGHHHGFYDAAQERELVADIREKQPDILLVGMSSPRKEQFIDANLEEMNVPVSLGVGGMFDIAAGRTQFAPHWVRKLCIEWLYRLCQEPARLWRRQASTLIPFMFLLTFSLIKHHGSRALDFLDSFVTDKKRKSLVTDP